MQYFFKTFFYHFCLLENLNDMIERDEEVEVGIIVILAVIDTEVIYLNKVLTLVMLKYNH